MKTLKRAFDWIKTDTHDAMRLVSVHVSAIATGVGGLILANQNFLLELIDRVAGHTGRTAIVAGVMFLVFLVPSLKCEFSPVPSNNPAPPPAPVSQPAGPGDAHSGND